MELQRKRGWESWRDPAAAASSPVSADESRKHRKVSRACDLCKAKKARCSGTLPCVSCAARAAACTYDARYSRGRPPTPPVVAVAPRTLPPPPPPLSGSPGPGTSRLPTPSSASSNHHQSQHVLTRRQGMATTGPHADADVPPSRALSPDVDMTEIEGQYFDPTSGLTFLHRAYRRLSSRHGDLLDRRHVSTHAERRQPLMSAGDRPFEVADDVGDETEVRLPDRETCTELVAFYFDACVVTYRIFHRPTVVSYLDAVLTNAERGRPVHEGLGHAKASIVLTILAIATSRRGQLGGGRRQDRDDDSGESMTSSLRRSDPFFVAAAALTRAETGLPRLESAQARLVQVLYLLQTSRMNQGWYVFGVTSQLIAALGLHRRHHGPQRRPPPQASSSTTPAPSRSPDYIVAQCRKRTFWAAYIMDKYLAVVFGRPSQHRDDDIDQDFPDCVNDADMTPLGPSGADALEDCHLDGLIAHARISRIVARISRDVYTIKRVSSHERVASARYAGRQLLAWRDSLPPHLGTVRPSSLVPSFRRQAIALRLAYAHAMMHANRPFLLGAEKVSDGAGTTGEASDDVRSSVAECLAAARAALETVDAMVADSATFHAFWWTSYVTFCALAVVYVWEIRRYGGGPLGAAVVDDGDDEDGPLSLGSLLELAERCRLHLDRATPTSSPNRRYCVVLDELRSEASRQSPRGPTAARTADYVLRDGIQDAGRQEATDDEALPLQQRITASGMAGQEVDQQLGEGESAEGLYGLPSLLHGWQTTDWLDLDSSALGPFAEMDGSPGMWELT